MPHNKYKEIIEKETKLDVTSIELLFNRSIVFPFYRNAKEKMIDPSSHSNPLLNVKDMGLYLIWEVLSEQHDINELKCVYVGKGKANKRIDVHGKKS
ncbi:hypothetical protein ACQ902_003940 [Vibrio mimicus]